MKKVICVLLLPLASCCLWAHGQDCLTDLEVLQESLPNTPTQSEALIEQYSLFRDALKILPEEKQVELMDFLQLIYANPRGGTISAKIWQHLIKFSMKKSLTSAHDLVPLLRQQLLGLSMDEEIAMVIYRTVEEVMEFLKVAESVLASANFSAGYITNKKRRLTYRARGIVYEPITAEVRAVVVKFWPQCIAAGLGGTDIWRLAIKYPQNEEVFALLLASWGHFKSFGFTMQALSKLLSLEIAVPSKYRDQLQWAKAVFAELEEYEATWLKIAGVVDVNPLLMEIILGPADFRTILSQATRDIKVPVVVARRSGPLTVTKIRSGELVMPTRIMEVPTELLDQFSYKKFLEYAMTHEMVPLKQAESLREVSEPYQQLFRQLTLIQRQQLLAKLAEIEQKGNGHLRENYLLDLILGHPEGRRNHHAGGIGLSTVFSLRQYFQRVRQTRGEDHWQITTDSERNIFRIFYKSPTFPGIFTAVDNFKFPHPSNLAEHLILSEFTSFLHMDQYHQQLFGLDDQELTQILKMLINYWRSFLVHSKGHYVNDYEYRKALYNINYNLQHFEYGIQKHEFGLMTKQWFFTRIGYLAISTGALLRENPALQEVLLDIGYLRFSMDESQKLRLEHLPVGAD